MRSAYRLQVVFAVSGIEWDGSFPFHDDGFEEPSLQRTKYDSEVRNLIEDYCSHLAKIGCVGASKPDDEHPEYLLITDDHVELPAGLYPWAVDTPPTTTIGVDNGRALGAVEGASFQLIIAAEKIEPEAAFATAASVSPESELSMWGGARTPSMLPKAGEERSAWLERVSASADVLRRLVTRLKHFGLDLELAVSSPLGVDALPDDVVEGCFALGEITTIVAPSGVGKTTLAHQMLATVAAPERAGSVKSFLGQTVRGQFYAALISGEEQGWYFADRQARYEGIWPGCGLIIRKDATQSTFEHELRKLMQWAISRQAKRGVLVIDAISNFLVGDDTKAYVASNFYQMLREFCLCTGWAIVGLHHTTKAAPLSFSQFRNAVRGSSVHVDLPRTVLGMLNRSRDVVEIGVIKSNRPGSASWLSQGESLLCRRDHESLTFRLMDPNQAPSAVTSVSSDAELILNVIGDLNRRAIKVQKSGTHGVFEKRLSGLAGLPRSRVQSTIDQLLADGRLTATPNGLFR